MQEPGGGQPVESLALAPIGGRSFWVYRAEPLPGDPEGDALFNAAFADLDARHREDRSGPIGLCVPVSDPELMRRRPEAVWPETELLYAGTEAGSAALPGSGPAVTQLRIRYFDDATVGPGLPNSPSVAESEAGDDSLAPGYRIVPLAETDAVGTEEILELWSREGAVPDPREAQRRVHEVVLVGLGPGDQLAGLSTAYLQRNAQLGMDLWYYRAFVAGAHRHSSLAVQLAVRGRDLLEERFSNGEDIRAAGIAYEVENEGLKLYFNRALWMPTDFTFIGENERGDHVRVHYFPGARAPIPQ
jgi:hypothetical protein